MKKIKYILSLFAVTVIVLTSGFGKKEPVFDFSNITLRDDNAYMAISKNNDEDYNRKLTFYFLVSKKENLTQANTGDYLAKNIKKATLYTDDGHIYITDALNWARIEKYEEIPDYVAPLNIIPDVDMFPTNNKAIKIERIVLSSDNAEQEYKLNNYFVEEKETLDEKDIRFRLLVSSQETLEFNYNIYKEENNVSSVELYCYQDFAPVKISSLDRFSDEREEKEENSYYFQIAHNKDEKNLLFKPFLKVTYNNGKQGLIVSNMTFDILTLSSRLTFEENGESNIIYFLYALIPISVILVVFAITIYKKKMKKQS